MLDDPIDRVVWKGRHVDTMDRHELRAMMAEMVGQLRREHAGMWAAELRAVNARLRVLERRR